MKEKVSEICLKYLDSEPSEVEEIEGGLNSHTYRVSVEDSDYIIQVGEASEPHELKNCVKSFEFLKESDVPVPEVVSGLKEHESLYFTIVEFIEGETLGEDFTGSEAEKAGKILAKIHSFREFDEAGWIEWKENEPEVTGFDEDSLKNRIRQLMEERAELFEERGLDELAKVANQFSNKYYQRIPENFRPVFVHHDFNPGNILAKDGEITAVLDLDYAHSSHPQRDLAKASNKFWLRGGDREDFYRGYKQVREIDESYSENEPLFQLESLLDEIAAMLDHEHITEEQARSYLDEIQRLESELN
ncbi:MAG: aminoglycoside phosphotransferase family protein [Candidatus Nanohaloarchaea archaeon]